MQWLVSLWSKQMVRYSWKLYRCDFFSVWFGLVLVSFSIFSGNNKLLILIVWFPLFFMAKKFMSTKRFSNVLFSVFRSVYTFNNPWWRYWWMIEWNRRDQLNWLFLRLDKEFSNLFLSRDISQFNLHSIERSGAEWNGL